MKDSPQYIVQRRIESVRHRLQYLTENGKMTGSIDSAALFNSFKSAVKARRRLYRSNINLANNLVVMKTSQLRLF